MKGGQTYSLQHADWGQVRQERRKIPCSRRPLQRLFQEYVDEHKDEFEAESARRPLQRFFQEYVDQEPAASFRSELVRLALEPVSERSGADCCDEVVGPLREAGRRR